MAKEGDLSGYGGEVGAIAVPIPQSAYVSSFEEYRQKMYKSEKAFRTKIQEKFFKQ